MSLILPSYQSGFAPRDYEPAYPSLWQGCVGAWAPLLGPTGLVLRDAVGGDHGTLVGGPVYQVSNGRYALDFDNSDDHVLLPDNFVVDQASRFSLSWWENITSNTGTYASRFILKTNGTRGLIVFRSTATGYTTLAVNGKNSGNYTNFPTAPSIANSVGIWRHWVLVNSVSVGAAGDNWKLWVDGIEHVYGGLGNAATAFGNPTSRIGLDGLGDDPTNARLDDIRIYNRALSDNEIRLLASRRGIGYEPRRVRVRYFRGFSPKKKLLEAKITSTIPGSYQTGYAPRDGEPVYPELWKGCVGAWSAGLGPSGLTLRDNSPAENHGTLVNGPTYQVSGGQYALGFDGSNDYVDAAPQGALYRSGSITISAWVYRRGASGAVAADYNAAGSRSSFVTYIRNGKLEFFWEDGTPTAPTIAQSSGDVTLNAWCHVCTTYDGTTRRVYINGKLDGSNATVQATPARNDVGKTSIGRGGDFNGLYLDANIDDVRIYHRPLSESEIKTLATRRNIAYEYKRPRTLFRAYDPIKQVGVGKITSIIPGGYHTGVGGLNNEPAYPELTKGLVGGWCPSLGVTGGLLRDNSGQGNHGSLENMDGADWQISDGRYCLDFDAVDDVVRPGGGIRLYDWTTQWTASVWFNVPDIASRSIIGYGNGQFFPYYIWHLATAAPNIFRFQAYDGTLGTVAATTAISVDKWYCGAVTYNYGAVSLYLNGALENSGNAPLALRTDVNDIFSIAKGNWTGSGQGQIYKGKQDDIRLYNRILSPNEIRLLASRRGIGYDFKTHRSYSKTQSSGLLKRLLLTGQT